MDRVVVRRRRERLLAIAIGLTAALACGWWLGRGGTLGSGEAPIPVLSVSDRESVASLRHQLECQEEVLGRVDYRLTAIERRLDALAWSLARAAPPDSGGH